MPYTRPDFDAADATFLGAAAYTLPTYNDADATWFTGDCEAIVHDTGLLGQPAAVLTTPVNACWLVDSGVLGQPSVLRYDVSVDAAVESPLGAVEVLTFHDFTALVAAGPISYVCDLVTSTGVVRVPISSWQATLQTEDQCYAGCVIPACDPYIDDIADSTHFVISRRVLTLAGDVLEDERVRSPITSATFDRGPTNHTCSVLGYFDAIPDDAAPHARYDRVLTGSRSTSTYSSGSRYRCKVDWLLRPATRAFYGETSFVVDFINTFVPSDGDEYSDVGYRI